MQLDFPQASTNASAASGASERPLVGASARMRIVHALIAKLARNNSTVLLTGESGTGKELAARSIHDLSLRRDQSFVPVNCGAIAEELLESELFGHVRGAFTGAVNARQGRFQLAHRGTLFLDEIGEMSPKLQVKLLRVLQEREFEPVGSDRAVEVDVRVIAATNHDLTVSVREGWFREDLFYRLNVLPLELPSLREREGDVPLLVHYFLHAHGQRKGKTAMHIDPAAMTALERYSWPGNVREVENLIERLVVLSDETFIRVEDLPDYVVENAPREPQTSVEISLPQDGVDLDGVLERIEDGFIQQALQRSRGNKTMAAEMLHLNRTTFIERLRKKGMLQTVRRNNATPANVSSLGEASLRTWSPSPPDSAEALSLAAIRL